MKKFFNKFLFVISFLILFCQPTFADVILPVVFITFPLLLLSLIFVILIEFFYYKRVFINIPTLKIIKATIIANIVSTLFGVPLAGCPWIAFVGHGSGLQGQIWSFLNFTDNTGPIKILIHICLYCLASFIIESFVIIFGFRKTHKASLVAKHVLFANLITYLIFGICFEVLCFCNLPFKH